MAMGRHRLGCSGASTLRKTRVLMAAAAGVLLIALAAVHTAPVRAFVLRRVVAAVRASYGIDVRAGSLSYNVLTLSAELRGVELASVDTPSEPFATADALGVTFGARTLIGGVKLRRVSLAAPRITITRHEDGTDNLPRVSGEVSDRKQLRAAADRRRRSRRLVSAARNVGGDARGISATDQRRARQDHGRDRRANAECG